jgi:hypothetical protein
MTDPLLVFQRRVVANLAIVPNLGRFSRAEDGRKSAFQGDDLSSLNAGKHTFVPV